ncbi:mycothiol synthase [Nakamurella leprariae]|uniref:Mycothiol acetyltransferase n=1 Tax=Nakamurella leprariae TaxID=2803911 RepID=A0A939BVJ9_9ACTN|nr:mycothiol synthase [Nakamurella leprariae]MBM9466598.1 mycothiol synthase [Nakamurella leprariae]
MSGRATDGPAFAAAVRDLVNTAAVVDGVPALSGHVLDGLADHPELIHLVDARSEPLPSDASGAAMAVGVLATPPGDPAEFVVLPANRRRGLGLRLVQQALDRGAPGVWSYGALPAAVALAGRTGLVATRELLQLRRPLSGELPDAVWPDGVRLRTFVPGQDEEQVLGVNARAFAWHPEQGRLDLAGLRAEMAQVWFDPAGFFLAVDADDTVLGFHWTKVHSADPTPEPGREPGPVGEVYVIGVDPRSPVRRLGSPLTAAGLHHLRDRGLGTVMLYVEGDNRAALALYDRWSFSTRLRNVVYRPPSTL